MNQHENPGPSAESQIQNDKPGKYNHNWLCSTLLPIGYVRRDLLRMAFSDERFDAIDASHTTLLSEQGRSLLLDSRVVDALMQVPLKNSDRKLYFRCLVEHKSKVVMDKLVPQLIGYQHSHYNNDKTPVVTVLVNNGDPYECDGVARMREWLDCPGFDEGFWRRFGDLVMDFGMIVINLQDPLVRQMLVESGMPSALGWYVLGHLRGKVTRQEVEDLERMSAGMSGEQISQVLEPALVYLDNYGGKITIEMLEQFGLRDTKGGKAMENAMSLREMLKEDGRQEGLHEGQQKIAERLLRRGMDKATIAEVTNLSDNTNDHLIDEHDESV